MHKVAYAMGQEARREGGDLNPFSRECRAKLVEKFGTHAVPDTKEWQQARAEWQRGWDDEDDNTLLILTPGPKLRPEAT
jgi:hypothetical protein